MYPSEAVHLLPLMEIPAREDHGVARFGKERANQDREAITPMTSLAAQHPDVNSRCLTV